MKPDIVVIRALLIALLAALISACGAGAAFDKAKQTNTIIAYDEFLREYSGSEYVEEARGLRELRVYDEAKASNSVESYQNYLREYPRGKYRLRAQANAAIDRLHYDEATDGGNILAYNHYLSLYPNGRFVAQVHSKRKKLLFEQTEQESTLAAYDFFLSEYPTGELASQARTNREKLAFELAKEQATISAYDSYLNEYYNGQFITQAKDAKEELVFVQAEQKSTITGYDYYLSEYPSGKFHSRVKNAREELVFAQAKQEQSIAGYDNYLTEYPSGKFYIQAQNTKEELVFSKAKVLATASSYSSYLNQYPDGKYAAEVRESHERLLFQRAVRLARLRAYKDYLQQYPNGKFANEARRTQEKLAFNQAVNTATMVAYDSYLTDYPNGTFVAQIHSAREKLMFAQAERAATISAYEQYLEQYPQSNQTDTVIKRIDIMRRTITYHDNATGGEKFHPAIGSFGEMSIGAVNKLKRLPFYYFVYLYTQAAKGQFLRLYAPVQPYFKRGEFESSKDFELRTSKPLQDWEEGSKIYENDLTKRRLQSNDSDRIFSWQRQAVRSVLSRGLSLDSLEYDADEELFSYSIISTSEFFPKLTWQGKLAIPSKHAQQFKSELRFRKNNLKLHFYLNPDGNLELQRISDIATKISGKTQNNTLNPEWLPNSENLSQLSLYELSLTSNVQADQARIGGINFGPTPLSIKLPSNAYYEIRVSRPPLDYYKSYYKKTELRGDTEKQVYLERNAKVNTAEGINAYIGVQHSNYTKLNANGDALSYKAHDWACVRDNHSGLVWEVKTDDGGPRDKDNTYRWGGKSASKMALSDGRYDYGDNERKQNLLYSHKGKRYDDWDVLVDTANLERLCGFSDWRVPDLHELASLVRCNSGYYENMNRGCEGGYHRSPTIDIEYFPKAVGNNSYYWSASPQDYSSTYDRDYRHAWIIRFSDGPDLAHYRENNYHVRLVRSSQ